MSIFNLIISSLLSSNVLGCLFVFFTFVYITESFSGNAGMALNCETDSLKIIHSKISASLFLVIRWWIFCDSLGRFFPLNVHVCTHSQRETCTHLQMQTLPSSFGAFKSLPVSGTRHIQPVPLTLSAVRLLSLSLKVCDGAVEIHRSHPAAPLGFCTCGKPLHASHTENTCKICFEGSLCPVLTPAVNPGLAWELLAALGQSRPGTFLKNKTV